MRVTHEMGYPLNPGTAVIASSECFACGCTGIIEEIAQYCWTTKRDSHIRKQYGE
jgi:hypothetical protein